MKFCAGWVLVGSYVLKTPKTLCCLLSPHSCLIEAAFHSNTGSQLIVHPTQPMSISLLVTLLSALIGFFFQFFYLPLILFMVIFLYVAIFYFYVRIISIFLNSFIICLYTLKDIPNSFFKNYLFTYFWLCRVFVAAQAFL